MVNEGPQVAEEEWINFPGGELQGKRPRTLGRACREHVGKQLNGAAQGRYPRPRTLCFQCYLAEFERERALKAAGELAAASSACGPREDSESAPAARHDDARRSARARGGGAPRAVIEERFQVALPFEPINRPRLEMLKARRATERATMREGTGRFVDRRHQAQIAARHALERIAAGLTARRLPADERARAMAAAIHAAELQLPEAWLPFVVSR